MGGSGSGTWLRTNTRATVEDCPIILNVSRLARDVAFRNGANGTLSWTNPLTDSQSMIARFAVREDVMGIVFCIGYEVGSTRLAYGIRMKTTKPNFGGNRWWFTCPLVPSGVPCERRVAKLYFAGRYFGCRGCHRLTYKKCQQSKRTREFEKNLLARHLGS